MHGEQLVVLFLALQEFQTRLEELSANDQSHHATEAEVNEGTDQVHVPNDLVVSGCHPLNKGVALAFHRRWCKR